MKRVLTVQDISCIGKCSLTAALPIISAMGTETAVLPTAVLSTHTAFKGFTFRDLTDDLEAITKHWKEQGIRFDALYTGYLGSFRQLDIVAELFDTFRSENTAVIVDPVMADNGALYAGFTMEFAKAMAKLCAKADYIMPNITEASFMLGVPYQGNSYTEAFIHDLLEQLGKLGAKTIVLKGIETRPGQIGIMAYTPETGAVIEYFHEKLPAKFHGTGDVFASCFAGALAADFSAEQAMRLAADYTVESIRMTMQNKNHNWYGVDFETAIPYLVHRLEQRCG
ncbi:MAG: pyridoxamine kinase [Bacteroides sp.]|nr:pyridoxamine kinase [Prevotella sp.]MCM1408414.1 pyridoxamine kinase [Treponema brennaborense]MCM1469424.1 pyridoxamine kinase [Bacteroides sp.]